MRTPREIYAAYNIMPLLQLHQVRVAAVGKLICDNFKKPIDINDVVLACLFHDMGNILKFDLALFPEERDARGIAYWQGIKDEYAKKYGTEHHAATGAIAKELSLPERVRTYITNVEFSKLEVVRDSSSYEQKICEYSDLRAGPHGVLSLKERSEEARGRYIHRLPPGGVDIRREGLDKAAKEIEQQIFSETKIAREDVTDTAVAPIIESLWKYPVPIGE